MPDDNLVFIGVEDGVSIYARRENVTGVDRAMQRDHMRREAADKAQGALYNFYKDKETK